MARATEGASVQRGAETVASARGVCGSENCSLIVLIPIAGSAECNCFRISTRVSGGWLAGRCRERHRGGGACRGGRRGERWVDAVRRCAYGRHRHVAAALSLEGVHEGTVCRGGAEVAHYGGHEFTGSRIAQTRKGRAQSHLHFGVHAQEVAPPTRCVGDRHLQAFDHGLFDTLEYRCERRSKHFQDEGRLAWGGHL